MATRQSTAKKKGVATTKKDQLPALANQFDADASAGFEEADQQAYAIPFLAVLQSGSPQCKRSEGEYIKGAEEGMFFNSADEEIYDGQDVGIDVIPVHYRRVFVEWKPRDTGGGFIAEHSAEDGEHLLTQCEIDEKNCRVLPNGNHLVDTRVHYCMMYTEDGDVTPVVICMTSTQIKKSRKWMTVMRQLKMTRQDGTAFNPPMFSHVYHLSTVPESNDKGAWMGYKVETGDVVNNMDHYQAAKQFRDSIVKGLVKATYEEQVASGQEEGAAEDDGEYEEF